MSDWSRDSAASRAERPTTARRIRATRWLPELHRLVHAIAAGVGIDTLVWLTDIAGLSREEAVDVMRWLARGLLQAALSEG